MQPIPRSFGTHDGTFHADEVTACALLLYFGLIDRDKIYRTRDASKLAICEYVCDVGGVYDPARKLFDHHQASYSGEWSSAGMVLHFLLETHLITDEVYHLFQRSLIGGVDAHDNGRAMVLRGYCTFSQVISNFTPITYDPSLEEQRKFFMEAVEFVVGHLDRLWRRYLYTHSCRQIVAERMKLDTVCLMFDAPIPWIESFFELGGEYHSALFVIMPSGEHWKLRGIPPTFEERMKVRAQLPAAWAGLLEEDLKRVSGIPGALFCHKERFISVWKSKEAALLALESVLKSLSK